jgi:RNA polymerase sigma factor (sigma-70 family)
MAMQTIETLERARSESWTDKEVVERVIAGDTALYEIIMRRYNQRIYRVTRAILRDEAEAEDVMQDAFVRAYQHLPQFAGLAPFSIWLTRIAVNEALRRLRLRNRSQQLDNFENEEEGSMNVVETSLDPEQSASLAELGRLLEAAVLNLPDQYRCRARSHRGERQGPSPSRPSSHARLALRPRRRKHKNRVRLYGRALRSRCRRRICAHRRPGPFPVPDGLIVGEPRFALSRNSNWSTE